MEQILFCTNGRLYSNTNKIFIKWRHRLVDFETKAKENEDRLAACMITYPSTHGVFEKTVKGFVKLHINMVDRYILMVQI